MIEVTYNGTRVLIPEGRELETLQFVEERIPADPDKKLRAAQRHEAWLKENANG